MAYRFLLEVPAHLAEEASVVVTAAGDAQVLVSRPGHGLGFDESYVNLTVAAHSLRLIEPLYAWAGDIGATRPESRVYAGVVLHTGQRLGMHETDPAGMVAAIRRDQPWVERFTPKIGEHEFDLPPTRRRQALAEATGLAVAEPRADAVLAVDLIDAEEVLSVRGDTYAVIQVNDLPVVERVYHDLLGLTIRQRLRQDRSGEWIEIGSDYDHATAAQDGTEADIAFLANGALHIALMRVGRSIRLDYANVVNELSITVSPGTAARIKALVLMRNYTMLTSTGPAFGFRDPFGVVWNVHPASA
jgi:hypothetical protein